MLLDTDSTQSWIITIVSFSPSEGTTPGRSWKIQSARSNIATSGRHTEIIKVNGCKNILFWWVRKESTTFLGCVKSSKIVKNKFFMYWVVRFLKNDKPNTVLTEIERNCVRLTYTINTAEPIKTFLNQALYFWFNNSYISSLSKNWK